MEFLHGYQGTHTRSCSVGILPTEPPPQLPIFHILECSNRTFCNDETVLKSLLPDRPQKSLASIGELQVSERTGLKTKREGREKEDVVPVQ